MEKTEDNIVHALSKIPILINNIQGDPFMPSQIMDTFGKLDSLIKSEHQGPIGVTTKSVISDNLMKKIAQYNKISNLIMFYTFTGLNEGNVSFDQRLDTFTQLSNLLSNVVLLFRPIVEGQNDSPELIRIFADLCQKTSSCLVYTGLYISEGGRENKKVLKPDTEKLILDICHEKKVPVFPKSSCATKHLLGCCCFAHVNEGPYDVDVAKYFYDVKYDSGELLLDHGTPGDLNFLRFITHKNPTILKRSPYHFLSLPTTMPLLCSSSFFSWSRVVPCDIGCWYCSADYVFPECKQPMVIGCNPADLVDIKYRAC